MDLQILANQYRKEIIRIAATNGASKVRIFGSVARGESNDRSDIDILVNFAPGSSLIDHEALMLDLEALPGCKVDVVMEIPDLWGTKKDFVHV